MTQHWGMKLSAEAPPRFCPRVPVNIIKRLRVKSVLVQNFTKNPTFMKLQQIALVAKKLLYQTRANTMPLPPLLPQDGKGGKDRSSVHPFLPYLLLAENENLNQ